MQPIPVRLAQAIRLTFQASKPPSRPFRSLLPPLPPPTPRRALVQPCPPTRAVARLGARFYSNSKKDIDDKIEEIKTRIDHTLDERASHINVKEPNPIPTTSSETILHAEGETSSIPQPTQPSNTSKPHSPPHTPPDPSLPSSQTSPLSARFSHLMDTFQSNLFTASRRLNDLTGYTGIQRLKDNITAQEDRVTSLRNAVRTARTDYAAAVATRSATQREVNDLLHRKHTWSPSDLERFTNLYRSDHANERAEESAQASLGAAESAYEEASTKLARTILSRYHEEQIWSDKIRQMSTWGTWGLMGLNVLLFVVFQIAIEPWRRRRLVRGFEEKVQEALKEVGHKTKTAGAAGQQEEGLEVADRLVEAVVDAISGVDSPEQDVFAEITLGEAGNQQPRSPTAVGEDLSFPTPDISKPPSGFATATASGYAYYQEAFAELFSDRKVVVTQKDLTTVALEGAAGGAALMGLLLVLLRPR